MKTLVRRLIDRAGYDIIKREPGMHVEGGMTTIHNNDFIGESQFTEAYAFGLRQVQNEKQSHGYWRVHVAQWAAHNAFRLDGDFVECGVYRGFVSSTIIHYLDWNKKCGDRRYFLIDTFSGLVDSLLTDDERKAGRDTQYGDSYLGTYDGVVSGFRNIRNVHVVKGTVPNILPQQDISSVAFLHLDMNCTTLEVEALRFFWPKMCVGGFVVMDDYAYSGYEPQHTALRDLARSYDHEILSFRRDKDC